MFNTVIDSKGFAKDMKGILDYSFGFLDGVERGKNLFLQNLGRNVAELLNNYIDSNARVSPSMLHHVYEWERVGNPDARLYDINYRVAAGGLSIGATFRQSTTVQSGSKEPFYNKAKIMEDGVPVVIKPKNAKVLAFNDGEEQVFTSKPIVISEPGGPETTNGFERVFESFFSNYFTQAYLQSSGLSNYLKNPETYRRNFAAAKRGGRALGVRVGFQWITKAGADL